MMTVLMVLGIVALFIFILPYLMVGGAAVLFGLLAVWEQWSRKK
jgi:hypothetical protein